jgi:hypothetical protein
MTTIEDAFLQIASEWTRHNYVPIIAFAYRNRSTVDVYLVKIGKARLYIQKILFSICDGIPIHYDYDSISILSFSKSYRENYLTWKFGIRPKSIAFARVWPWLKISDQTVHRGTCTDKLLLRVPKVTSLDIVCSVCNASVDICFLKSTIK